MRSISKVIQDRAAAWTICIGLWALTAYSHVAAKKKEWRTSR